MALQDIRGIRLGSRPRPGSGDFSRDLDQYVAGNKLLLLPTGGEVYRSMWEAIQSARETIHLETYILRSDKTGQRFAEHLEAKARSGVRVRVIFDSVGSLDLSPVFISRLRNAGVQFLEYHPLAPWRPRWSLVRRDHRKMLIVDSRIAFTGGVNICDDHAPIEDGGSNWHDVHVRLEGPAAFELDRFFRAVWYNETGRWFKLESPDLGTQGPSKVWAAANQEFLHRYRIRAAYLGALRAAQKEVIIANAYFVPDLRITRALAAAARRRVQVKILVQGLSDILSVWYAGRYQYDYLLRHGVRLFEWPGPVLHAKTAVVDGLWCTVGSYNLDHRSLLHNLEVNLHVLDPNFSGELKKLLESDIALSPELRLERWRRRPYADKCIERFFYLFRYFF
ncbi:MAG: cardiolipin synthase ClsB [Elusimicrobia bacterium]|nr:cardiolipin synthase ClsB [Elusimicrobiota bacterium]